MRKEQKILAEACRLAETVETWTDFSNALFNPDNGLVSTAYPVGAARNAFMKSAEYRKIMSLHGGLIDKFGLVAGASPKKSGRFVVRLPASLHYALEREAQDEGVSLNQLVLAKLAVQLHRAVG